jgi:hypothetical protein
MSHQRLFVCSRGFYIPQNDALQSVVILWNSDQLVADTSDNTQHSQQTNVRDQGGFASKTSAGKRPQIYVLDRAAIGNGTTDVRLNYYDMWIDIVV